MYVRFTYLLVLVFFGLSSCRISDEKCMEYTRPFLSNKIPISRLSSNSHGKTPVNIGEFPHVVVLGFGENETSWYDCGGSLISEQFVLTSLTCTRTPYNLDRLPVTYAAVGVNDLDTMDHDSTVQRFKIIEIFKYPDVDEKISRFHVYNDIALLKLDRPVIFNEYVRPACLFDNFKLSVNTEVSAAAWGGTIGNKSTNKINKVYFDLFDEKDCTAEYNSFYQYGYLDKLSLCAGGRKNVRNTCSGDDGSPLHLYNKDRNVYDVIGITSFGIRANCRTFGVTRAYTRVAAYIPWIEHVVWTCEENFRTSEELNAYIVSHGHPPNEPVCSKRI